MVQFEIGADVGKAMPTDIIRSPVGPRETGWLSPHDPLKVGQEYRAVARGLENFRLLIGIAINGTLLLNAGDQSVRDLLGREDFFVDERLGFAALVPSSKRLVAAISARRIEIDLHSLDQILVGRLAERGLSGCIGIVEVNTVGLESPIRVLTSIFASFRDTAVKVDEKAFPFANKVVVYGTLLTMIFQLANYAGKLTGGLQATPPAVEIAIPGTDIQLGSDFREWMRRLNSKSVSEHITAQQEAFQKIGIKVGSIDGLDGPRTRSARDVFAKRHGLEAWDSDPDTLARLLALTVSASEFRLPRKETRVRTH